MFDAILKNDTPASKHINIAGHYADDTLIDKSGKLIKIIKIKGINASTCDTKTLDTYKNRRNNLLKHFSSHFALYFWERRRKQFSYPDGKFEAGFAKSVDANYKAAIESASLYETELYLSIMTKQPEGLINKGFDFVKQLNLKVDKLARDAYLKACHQELNAMTDKVIQTFADYDCEVLSIVEKNRIKFSSMLAFLSSLLNFNEQIVPLDIGNADSALLNARLFFNRRAGRIELRDTAGKSQYAAMLSIKNYSPLTYQGMLNALSLLPIEYNITQSFRFYDKQVAKVKLRDQQKDMAQSKEESLRLTNQIDDVYEDTASGEVGYGLHHFSMLCYADSLPELNQAISLVVAKFADLDITCVREDIASECAFWAQLPGNFSYIPRAALISTKNMAALASLHNYPKGKLTDNHWGDAVTVFETMAGSPYYFNFHYKDVGNFLVFGSMGSGKTTLVGFLILQSMKFGGKRIIFDKDRGLEIMVRALRGTYEMIKPGIATGFNPCQLEDTPANREFLKQLFTKMLNLPQVALSESDKELITKAVDGLYRLDKTERRLCHLASFFGVKRPGSIRARFDQWHSEGAHAWAFDNAADTLNLEAAVLGFGLDYILISDVKLPVLMYLTYRAEMALAGQRGMLFCDEGWLALNDDYFAVLINDWSRTPRKKNNIFGLATQAANDTVGSFISKAINESAPCKIFFPNPQAEKKVYVDELGLTAHEYHLVKTLPDDQHYFLLQLGRGANKESVVLRANLSALQDEIAIISGREETLLLLDQIRLEVGDDPDTWLPLFHERRKIRIAK